GLRAAGGCPAAARRPAADRRGLGALARRRRDRRRARRGSRARRLLLAGAAARRSGRGRGGSPALAGRAGHDRTGAAPPPPPSRRRAPRRRARGNRLKHVARQLRASDDAEYERFSRLSRAIGPAVVAPLAETLSIEQDARSRRRLRDILVQFGAAGREAVQQLMNAANWEVRRTAAFLLREFGGAEGLKEL